jgi:proteasome accessory factor BC
MAVAAEPGGRDLSQRLAKIETAISRRKTILFTYYTIERDSTEERRVDPYHLVFRGSQFYLIGHSHERYAVRVFRLSRIRDKVSYATKAEHDFTPPESFDRRDYARRVDWQLGELRPEPARMLIAARIAWLIERDFGRHGEIREASEEEASSPGDVVFETSYASERQLVSWVLGWRDNARVLGPSELAEEAERRRKSIRERHDGAFQTAEPVSREPRAPRAEPRSNGHGESPIRPERFARLTTLAGMLIEAGREGQRPRVSEVLEALNLSEKELREDIEVLNIVNFGGGTYVLYAEIQGDEIEVDTEAYGDNFARPARLLPLEAKALVAAIDLLGAHLPEGGQQSAREKVVAALGHDPAEEGLEIAPGVDDSDVAEAANRAIAERRVLELRYYKENEDEFTERRVEPYRLENGEEGWYVECYDPEREAVRHFKLERIKEARVADQAFEPRPEVEEQAHLEGWLTHGEVPDARVARVWVSPERARWLAEERTVLEELADGAVTVEIAYAGEAWLVREILKGAGDLVVLEPADAREAVRIAVS